jgi:hypothetical protein
VPTVIAKSFLQAIAEAERAVRAPVSRLRLIEPAGATFVAPGRSPQ